MISNFYINASSDSELISRADVIRALDLYLAEVETQMREYSQAKMKEHTGRHREFINKAAADAAANVLEFTRYTVGRLKWSVEHIPTKMEVEPK